MIEATTLSTRTGPLAAIGSMLCALTLLPACAPVCQAVDDWTWGTCYSDLHGEDDTAVRSTFEGPPASDVANAVDSARIRFKTYVRETNVPGLSVAVGLGDEIVWAEGFGFADIETGQPVTPRTLFRIGGAAIPMTATAVGLLIERGMLDIDLPVQSYVPEFPEKSWPITTRQLMAHVSGMRHPDDEQMLYRRRACTRAAETLADYADARLRFEPGTAFRYSSYGWSLVAAVAESAAGEPFLEFLQREVFAPAALQSTVPDDPNQPAAGTTTFYWPFAERDTRTGIEYANNPNDTCAQGAGALLTTPSDLVRFGLAILGGRLIDSETLTLLQTPMVLANGESTGHALGWSVQQMVVPVSPGAIDARRTITAFGHDAVAAGGTTSLLTLPELRLVIALTANVSHAPELPALATRLGYLLIGAAE